MEQPYKNAVSVVLALLMGCVTGGLSLEAGRNTFEGSVVTRYIVCAQSGMKQVTTAVEAYREKHGTLPATLARLDDDVKTGLHIGDDGVARIPYDGSYFYRIHGAGFTIICYGRDGKPGGAGLDADLTSDDAKPSAHKYGIDNAPQARMTLKQFVMEKEAREMVVTAVCAGIVTLLLALRVFRPADLTRSKLLPALVGAVGVLIVTVFVGAVITILHVPSGH